MQHIDVDKELKELNTEKDRFEKVKQEILQTVENKKTELQSLNDKCKKTQEDLKKTQEEIEAEEKRRKEL